MKNALILIILFAAVPLAGQDCGPSCPACSGYSEGALLSPRTILFTATAFPAVAEEKGLIQVRYGALPWLDAGLGYAAQTRKILWTLRVQPLAEDAHGWRPGIVFGTGSIRIGSNDQSLYGQLFKSLEISESASLRLSLGVAALVSDMKNLLPTAGIMVGLSAAWTVFAQYDGRSFHEGLTWMPLKWLNVSAILVESRHPGVSLGFQIPIGPTEGGEDANGHLP